MALRLADYVVRGEIFNTRKHCVHGWIQLRDEEQPLHLQLTGNCDPDLAGWHFRFEARPQANLGWDQDDEEDESSRKLPEVAWQQIGATGEMTAARRVRVADCTPRELYMRAKLNELPPTRWVRCLYLEWYSQNGRVVIELPDPILEFVERTELKGVPMCDSTFDPEEEPPEGESGTGAPALGITEIRLGEDGEPEIRHQTFSAADEDGEEVEPDDPYGLVPDDLQRSLDAQATETDRTIGGEDDSEEMREERLMDALIESGDDVPLCSIFEKPMRLPRPEDLDDRQVEIVFKTVLGQLALCGVALHMCEHFTPRDAYKLLVEKIFFEERVFPQLKGTGWTQNFMTSEYCRECEAEAERQFEEMERQREEDGND